MNYPWGIQIRKKKMKSYSFAILCTILIMMSPMTKNITTFGSKSEGWLQKIKVILRMDNKKKSNCWHSLQNIKYLVKILEWVKMLFTYLMTMSSRLIACILLLLFSYYLEGPGLLCQTSLNKKPPNINEFKTESEAMLKLIIGSNFLL